MAVIGELATLVTAKVAPFNKGLDQASAKAKTFSGTLKSGMGKALASVSAAMKRAAVGVTALAGALTAGLVVKSVQLAAKAESMQVSYKVYLKSLEKANALLAEITKFSDATPFEPDEIKEAGKQLLAFGFSADQIMPTIKVLGDIAAGSQKPIADFVDILGKVKASGIASMADINRLADRGVPVFQELSRVMGVSTSEVRKLVGSAKVGFNDVWQVLKNVTSEGGLFKDAMVELSKTAEGKLSTLTGKIKGAMTEIGTAIIEGLDFKALQDNITNLVTTYKQDIVDVTVKGVELITAALEKIGFLSRQGSMAMDLWGAAYHKLNLLYYQNIANTRGSDTPDHVRQRLMYHNEAYTDAIQRGTETRTRMDRDMVRALLQENQETNRILRGGQSQTITRF